MNNTGRTDESLLTPANAQVYGEFLGNRFGRKGIIWILGGDRTATGFEETWRTLARGIAIGVSGKEDYDAVLMSFHPRGGETSSTWFHNDPWLDFNMHQTGHGLAEKGRVVGPHRARLRAHPCQAGARRRAALRGSSAGIPVARERLLVRRARAPAGLWDVFSGACGHTYGNHSVWQMYAPGRKPINGPLLYWYEASAGPGPARCSTCAR